VVLSELHLLRSRQAGRTAQMGAASAFDASFWRLLHLD